MPVTPTFPGVYIEEIPSGVRTITGVATSITAFLGGAARGPVEEPVTVTSFCDYDRVFGGLDVNSMMSYAVRDFYLNGGSQAIIVRLANGATPAIVRLPTGAASPNAEVTLEAANPGAWGNNLSALVDYKTREAGTDLFNLTVTEQGGATEKFFNVSTNPNNPRFLPRVLAQSSGLVRVRGDMPAARPLETFTVASPPSSPPRPDPVAADANSDSDGSDLTPAQFEGDPGARTGIFALDGSDLFNLLCIPPPVRDGDTAASIYQIALSYCVRRRAMLIVDPPAAWAARPETAATPLLESAEELAVYEAPAPDREAPLHEGEPSTRPKAAVRPAREAESAPAKSASAGKPEPEAEPQESARRPPAPVPPQVSARPTRAPERAAPRGTESQPQASTPARVGSSAPAGVLAAAGTEGPVGRHSPQSLARAAAPDTGGKLRPSPRAATSDPAPLPGPARTSSLPPARPAAGAPSESPAPHLARRPAPQAAPAGPEPQAPIVRVSIGRVEVRAILPEPPRAPAARPGPSLTLDEYLKKHGASRG